MRIAIVMYWKLWKIVRSPDEAWVIPILGEYTVVQVYTWLWRKAEINCGFVMELHFVKNLPKIMYFFLIRSNPEINKTKANKLSLYSDIVWLSLSLVVQIKILFYCSNYYAKLNNESLQCSSIKFLNLFKLQVWQFLLAVSSVNGWLLVKRDKSAIFASDGL